METAEISLETRGSQVFDLTAEAARFCRSLGDGLLSVFAPHATAGVALMELGSGSEPDLAEVLERLLPAMTATGTATEAAATGPTISSRSS